MEAAVVWVVLGIVLAVAEMLTLTFVLLTLGVGAFLAAGAAALGAPLWVQLVVFGAGSAVSLGVLRPVLRRHRENRVGVITAGAEAIEGVDALVLETVNTDKGMVKIGGELWTARSFDATQVMEAGEHVQVVKIEGATALVWRN